MEGPFTWLDAWGLPRPIALRPTGRGINNRTFFVDAPAGGWFLRIYQNTRDPARVSAEHGLLLRLQTTGLWFGVPRPVATRAGDTFVVLPDGALAALFELLPGQTPTTYDDAYLRACGGALGELHGALRAVGNGAEPAGAKRGALDYIQSFAPDRSTGGERMAAIFAAVRADAPRLYATLPSQPCHNDFFPANTLQVDGQLTAVVDFEFAASDLRAIDLLPCLLLGFPDGATVAERLGRAAAFLDGYHRHDRLSPSEAHALPTLARLTRAAHLVHWLGRHCAGLDPEGHHRTQIERLVELDDFLAAHGDQVIALAGG